tara:strand:- start:858 stop:1241 length:384 start_codon:yes stop_codon:yes gene_type:complete
MSEIKIGTNRSFGIVFFIFFIIISIWPLKSGEPITYWALVLSLIFLILGLINSKILTPLNKIWFKFGIFLGNIISPIIMGFIYFFVVTPIGFFMRIIGKDILNLKKNNNKSYWIEKKKTQSNMKKQF